MKNHTIHIFYAGQSVDLIIPEVRLAGVCTSKSLLTLDPDVVLKDALAQPLSAPLLDDFIRKDESLLIIVNDGARHTPTAFILEMIRSAIENTHVEFLVATGSHRSSTEFELQIILGDFYQSYRSHVYCHDCRNPSECIEIGKTSLGTQVFINHRVMQVQKILVIGSVEPHYFAGFTGGRKGLVPGVAGFQTIEQNHSHAMSNLSEPMKLDGNPVHDDMVEAVRLIPKEIYSIQLVLDSDDQIYAASAGDLHASLEVSANMARDVYGSPVQQKADIVIAVAVPPLDCDLYQSQKAMEHARLAVNPGGILILVSACHQGIGPDHFYQLLTSDSNPDNVLNIIQQGYKLGHHKAANWISLSKQVSLYCVTQINPKKLRSIDMRPFDTVQEAVDQALREKSGKVLVMPSASVTVPVLGSRSSI